MTDLIRKAVELADGWELTSSGTWIECMKWSALSCNTALVPDYVLDALAAQLVRQIDATEYNVEIDGGATRIVDDPAGHLVIDAAIGPDRTMNTIKAIVESGVLE